MFRNLRVAATTLLGSLALLGATAGPSHASSHSDAPLIKLDPQANLSDVYAFIGKKYNQPGTKVLNVVVNVHPFCEPGDGVLYDKFADDALYNIHITNPTTGAVVTTYQFKFSSVNSGYKFGNTILSYGRGTGGSVGPILNIDDNHQNFTQTYTITRINNDGSTVALGSGTCPPPNVGARTTPLYNDLTGSQFSSQANYNPNYGRALSGATTEASLDSYTKQAVTSVTGGGLSDIVFAGSREDSFYADAPGIFDLLDSRILVSKDGSSNTLGQDGKGTDGFKGYNVLTYAIQIPVSELPSVAYSGAFSGAFSLTANPHGVGVFASVSRPRVTLRSSTGNPVGSGPYVQVNRLANPLFNEVLVALQDKDNYNRSLPVNDAQFAQYALQPELPVLLNAVFGTSFATTGRADLKAVYIPDVIRVNTDTPPVTLDGAAGFSRFGFLGGDTVTYTAPGGGTATENCAWPNGRRFGDDVVDIALTAVASGPTFSTVTVVGDNVPSNDQAYNQVFPYAATPNSGTRNSKDSGPNVGF